ncbi:unnamed protein product, partial [Choristocarpus tenellus]
MLFVDPGLSDPKYEASRLEDATARLLRRICVFDMASDVLQVMSDVRDDTLRVYQVVFINDSLDDTIKGKELARFLRQAGVSAHMVLLVDDNTNYDDDDMRSHCLCALLRKPFS